MSTDTIPEKQLESYYRKSPKSTEGAIQRFLQDNQRDPKLVVYGSRAVNAYLPTWLDKETEDWDVFTDEDAEGVATKLEKLLDKRYGGDFFIVEPAVHTGTFRVKSKVTGGVVADITLADKMVLSRRLHGVNYVPLEHLEEEAKRVLADPAAAYRHRKDRDTLQRIAVSRVAKERRAERRKARENDPFPAFRGIR